MLSKRHGHRCDSCGCVWRHDPDKFRAASWKRYPEAMACAEENAMFLYMLHHLCPRCGRPQYQKVEFHENATWTQRRDMGEVSVASVMRNLATSILPPKFRGAVQQIVDTVEPPSPEDEFMMMFLGVFTRRKKSAVV